MPNFNLIMTKGMIEPDEYEEFDERIRALLGGYQIVDPRLSHVQRAVLQISKGGADQTVEEAARSAFKHAVGEKASQMVSLLGLKNLVFRLFEPAYVSTGVAAFKGRSVLIDFGLGGKDDIEPGVDIRTDEIRRQVAYAVGAVIADFLLEKRGWKHNVDYSLTGEVGRVNRHLYCDKDTMDKGVDGILDGAEMDEGIATLLAARTPAAPAPAELKA